MESTMRTTDAMFVAMANNEMSSIYKSILTRKH